MKIDVRHLHCYDENDALLFGDSTFSIESGQKIAIVTKNSFTASLLCHALGGIQSRIHPAFRLSGSVFLQNMDILTMDIHERIKLITYVPPDSDLLLSGVKDTVFGEVALSLELRGIPRVDIMSKVTDTLNEFGIFHLSDRNPDELSGGERHKVSLATIFVSHPSTLILDNPSLYLDGSGLRALIKIIRNYPGTVIISDPNPLLWGAVASGFICQTNRSFHYVESTSLVESILTGSWEIESPPWLDVLGRLRKHGINTPTLNSTNAADGTAIIRELMR
jgi:energy-coupling factor transporter ATP-binding protein EcfA2